MEFKLIVDGVLDFKCGLKMGSRAKISVQKSSLPISQNQLQKNILRGFTKSIALILFSAIFILFIVRSFILPSVRKKDV